MALPSFITFAYNTISFQTLSLGLVRNNGFYDKVMVFMLLTLAF